LGEKSRVRRLSREKQERRNRLGGDDESDLEIPAILASATRS
jgi:hypothetical protein